MDNGTIALFIPILGIIMLMIPVAGFTARFAAKPIVEALLKAREASGANASPEVRLLEQRVALLEQQLQGMESTVHQLAELRQFDRQLSGDKS